MARLAMVLVMALVGTGLQGLAEQASPSPQADKDTARWQPSAAREVDQPFYLGLQATAAGRPEARRAGIGAAAGAAVLRVDSSSPAERAGLRRGDLIVRYGEYDIENVEDLVVAFSLVLARCACWLDGCCFGRPTSLPWGVVYPWNSPAYLVEAAQGSPLALIAPPPLHPTPLYEAIGAAAIGLWCWLRGRSVLPSGQIAIEGWCAFAAFRLGNDFLRSPLTIIMPWTPLLHSLFLIVGVLVLHSQTRRDQPLG